MADCAPPGIEVSRQPSEQPSVAHTTTMRAPRDSDDQVREQTDASADLVARAALALEAQQGGEGQKPKEKSGKDQGGKKGGKKGGGKGGDGKGGKGKMSAPPSGPFGHGGLGFRLNVKNFSAGTTAEDLKALFEPFGSVTGGEVKVREDGKSRGFGFVILQTEEEARAAMVGMNNKPINGKPLQVSPAERRVEGDEEEMGMGMGMGVGKGMGKGMGVPMGKGKAPGQMPGMPGMDPAAMQAAMFHHHHMMMMQQAQLYNPYLAGAGGAGGNPYLAGAGGAGGLNPYLNPYLAGAGGLDPATGLPALPGLPGGAPGMPPPFGLPGAPGMTPYPGLPGLGGMPGYGMPPLPGMPLLPGSPPAAAEVESLPNEHEGTLKSINARSGYGFIACGETYAQYTRDIYVDRELLPPGVKVPDRLKFTVAMNAKGHPKAVSCRLAD